MAVTYGFYDSVSGDRKYNAAQMSSIFDGIIRDGVFAHVGNKFYVTAAGNGMTVTVGSGRAWFNRKWTYSDSDLAMNVGQADVVLDRIDAIVLEVDARDSARTNSIRFVTGALSSVPRRPTLVKEGYVNQYPLAYIYVTHGATTILQQNITNMVGTDETPFVTGPLETVSASVFLGQWQDQWDREFTRLTTQSSSQATSFAAAQAARESAWNSWFASINLDLATYVTFNFDNLAALTGVDYDWGNPLVSPNMETIAISSSGQAIARRRTIYTNNDLSTKTGTITEVVYRSSGTVVRTRNIAFDFNTGKMVVT